MIIGELNEEEAKENADNDDLPGDDLAQFEAEKSTAFKSQSCSHEDNFNETINMFTAKVNVSKFVTDPLV